MRFQTDLAAPSETVAEHRPLLFVTTDRTRAWAAALAARLRAEGFDVEESYDEGDEDPDEVAEVVGDVPGLDPDVYQELLINTENAPMDAGLCVLHEGAFLSVDAEFTTDPQPFWSAVMRLLAAIRDELGWVSDRQADLEQGASVHHVAADGRVVRPAELTREELDAAVVEVLDRVPADHDRPRDVPSDSRALAEGATALAELLASAEVEFPMTVHVTDGSAAIVGVKHDLDEDATFPLCTTAFDLRERLGSKDTGRIAALVLHRAEPADGAAPVIEIEPVFDRIPASAGSLTRYPLWESVVREMLCRAPEWQPYWLPEVTAVMERAGINLGAFAAAPGDGG